jgi:eukaryotic-like serine/threonine-protein kinase
LVEGGEELYEVSMDPPMLLPSASRRIFSRRTLLLSTTVVALAMLVALPNGAIAGSGPAPNGHASGTTGSGRPIGPIFQPTVLKSSNYDWPELHQNPLLTGFASWSSLSSLNASQLGVAWATNVYGTVLDSPVVEYDPILGETLAYVGTETGNVVAVNVANGQIVWGIWLGSPVRSSPLVNGGSLYIGTDTTAKFYKINATTGAIDCTLLSPDPFEATPTFATPPGGVPTVFFPSLDEGSTSAPFLAINAGNCSLEWKFSGYNQEAGSWSSTSYVVNAAGIPMVLFGTDNPDSSVYALNALTGTLLWRFQCYNPPGADFDVAAGIAISPPGKNGFAQGVAYVVNKADRAYALDLNNGTLRWETNFDTLAGNTSGVARSTPALDGVNVIFGFQNGLFDLNYTTGAQIWQYHDPTDTESLAAPAIAGGHGHGIVITGDVGGSLDVLTVTGGRQLYTYSTGSYIIASPAVSGGNIVIATGSGYLYDFAVGGSNQPVLPTTSVTSPAQGSSNPNPNGNLVISGTATDPVAVAAVDVAIQSDGNGGPWWDAASGTWSPGPIDNLAKLASLGATSTSWTLDLPVPAAGGTFEVFANAASSAGEHDVVGAQASFGVNYTTTGPRLLASSEYVAPGAALTVSGGGFGASEKVVVSLRGKTVATLTTLSSGALPSTRVVVPSNTPFGLTSLVAVGKTSGRTSSAAIIVANSWDQLGYDAGHTGYEPNDRTLNYLIAAGQTNWIQTAWHFNPGAPLETSPAVVDGVAYVADTAGSLYALDTFNGGLLWNFTLASHASIEGSPAVDLGRGLVFIGAGDGTVDAVHLSNGTLAWSTSVGGNVFAPVLGNGEVYVTTSAGTVAALSETHGTSTWSVTLASSVASAPAVNLSVDLLAVGESNGKVVALNTTSGATLWSYTTGGAVTASPTVSVGSVFVGSADHYEYALNQNTGALLWSFNTGGVVADTGALSDQHTVNGVLELIVGTSAGRLFGLQASNGAKLFTNHIGSAVIGVAAMDGIAVLESSNGNLTAVRTYEDDTTWTYQTSAGLDTAPAMVDGTVYVSAEDGNLYAFTVNGDPPE